MATTGANTSGMSYIRGIDIDKAAKGFAEEELVFKKFVTNSTTSAREIRWYQKTSGFLTATTTSAGTNAPIANVPELALPNVVEQSWTRQTSYVRKYFVESPVISQEDLADSDPDILAGNIRDLTRAIAYQIDLRIWDVMTESRSVVNISNVTTNAPWNTASYTGVNIVEDLLEAKMNLRNNSYNPEGAVLFLSPLDHKSLLTWLIDGKGASIPQFSSQRVGDGVVMEILGLRVVVSTLVTADYACVAIPDRAVTWKEFVPLITRAIEEIGIGTKIRCWCEGEAILTDPKAVSLITNTQA